MALKVTCPQCKQSLLVSSAAESRWITCPRCLASIRNPGFDMVTPRATEPVAESRTPRECPSCGRSTEAGWQICPFCERPLQGGAVRPARRPRPDDDTLRDNRGVNVGLLVLGILLVVGVMLFAFTGGIGLILEQHDVGSAVAIGGTVLALLVGGLIVIGVSSRDQEVMAVTRGFGYFVAGAGIVCLMLLAVCIGVLNTCLHNVRLR